MTGLAVGSTTPGDTTRLKLIFVAEFSVFLNSATKI